MDEGPGSVNRTTSELSEVGDGIALVEAFSHLIALRTSEGLVLFDTSLEVFAAPILTSLRRWSDARVHTIAYTHGHIDHVGGSQAFVEDARARGHAPPRFVGHENVAPRFARYQLTSGWNKAINTRQFGRGGMVGAPDAAFGPKTWVRPDTRSLTRDSASLAGRADATLPRRASAVESVDSASERNAGSAAFCAARHDV